MNGNASVHTETELRVGYAREDITPTEPVPLRGYGNASHRMSERVLSHLCGTCLAVTDGRGETVLIYALDLCECTLPWMRPMLSEKLGIPRDHIMISCSHTHSGPEPFNTDWPSAERFCRLLDGRLVEAGKAALSDRRPVRSLSGAAAMTEHLGFIRRYVRADGSYAGDNYGDLNPSPLVRHESEPDREMRFVKFTFDSAPDVLLVNFQVHPQRTGGIDKHDLSADIVGEMRDEAERRLGCRFIYFTGGAGNVRSNSRFPEENVYPDYITHGRAMAEYAVRAEGTYRPLGVGAVRTMEKVLTYPSNRTELDKLEDARKIFRMWKETNDRPACTRAANELGLHSVYHAESILRRADFPPTQDIEINAVSFGDVGFVFAPYEMFDVNARQIMDASPFPMTVVCSCANDCLNYIPSAMGFDHGGYDADNCFFLPGTGEKLAGEFAGLLKDLRSEDAAK